MNQHHHEYPHINDLKQQAGVQSCIGFLFCLELPWTVNMTCTLHPTRKIVKLDEGRLRNKELKTLPTFN